MKLDLQAVAQLPPLRGRKIPDDKNIDVLEILRERTVVPIEALEHSAKCSQPIIQMPAYMSQGLAECMEEASKSVRFVRNSANLLTERLKKASRSVTRGGTNRLTQENLWEKKKRAPRVCSCCFMLVFTVACIGFAWAEQLRVYNECFRKWLVRHQKELLIHESKSCSNTPHCLKTMSAGLSRASQGSVLVSHDLSYYRSTA